MIVTYCQQERYITLYLIYYCVVPENIHTPPTEGIFHMTPPPLWIFQKWPTNYTPPPLRKFQFFPTPPGNISISCLKRKIS